MFPKMIIFDMDGTLYDLNDVLAMNYEMQVQFLIERLNMSKNEVVDLFECNLIFPYISMDSKSATELFLKLGIDKTVWSLYRETHFDFKKIDVSKAVKSDTFKKGFINSTLILLTSNSYVNAVKILNKINIESALFKEIVCSDNSSVSQPFNKRTAMIMLAQKYQIDYSDILSVGDRYSTDILPMLELGGHGILIYSPASIEKVFEDLKDGILASCEEYKYYNSNR